MKYGYDFVLYICCNIVVTDMSLKMCYYFYSRFPLPIKQRRQQVPSRRMLSNRVLSQPKRSHSRLQMIRTLTLHHQVVIIFVYCMNCIICIISVHPSITCRYYQNEWACDDPVFTAGCHNLLVFVWYQYWVPGGTRWYWAVRLSSRRQLLGQSVNDFIAHCSNGFAASPLPVPHRSPCWCCCMSCNWSCLMPLRCMDSTILLNNFMLTAHTV